MCWNNPLSVLLLVAIFSICFWASAESATEDVSDGVLVDATVDAYDDSDVYDEIPKKNKRRGLGVPKGSGYVVSIYLYAQS